MANNPPEFARNGEQKNRACTWKSMCRPCLVLVLSVKETAENAGEMQEEKD